jgi:hypothetical protein
MNTKWHLLRLTFAFLNSYTNTIEPTILLNAKTNEAKQSVNASESPTKRFPLFLS